MIKSEFHDLSIINDDMENEVTHEFSDNLPLGHIGSGASGNCMKLAGEYFSKDSLFQELYSLREQEKGEIFGNTFVTASSCNIEDEGVSSDRNINYKEPKFQELSDFSSKEDKIESESSKSSVTPCRILPEDTLIYNNSLKFKGRVRFNRTHDCQMFHTLLEVCDENNARIEDFWKSFDELSSHQIKILKELSEKVMWKRKNFTSLHSRICKIGARRETFTVREIKFLKKMVNRQLRKGYTNFQELAYYFPGKTVDKLTEKYNQESKVSSENAE